MNYRYSFGKFQIKNLIPTTLELKQSKLDYIGENFDDYVVNSRIELWRYKEKYYIIKGHHFIYVCLSKGIVEVDAYGYIKHPYHKSFSKFAITANLLDYRINDLYINAN